MSKRSSHPHHFSTPPAARVRAAFMLAIIILIGALVAAITLPGCKAGGTSFKYQSGPINAAASSVGSAKTRFDWVNHQGTIGQRAWPKWLRPFAAEMTRQGEGGLADMTATEQALGQTIGELNAAKTTAITWKERHDSAVVTGQTALAFEQDRFLSMKQRGRVALAAVWVLTCLAIGIFSRAWQKFGSIKLPGLLGDAIGTAAFIASGLGILWLYIEAKSTTRKIVAASRK